MKKILLTLGALALGIFGLTGCSSEDKSTTEEETETKYYDVSVDSQNPYDHYFSNKVTLASTGSTVSKNSSGKLEGKFIQEGIAKLKLKSVTDGDTAVFYLNNEEDLTDHYGAIADYITVRFLSIDTPESTSSIDPWGKKASKYALDKLKNAEGIIVDATDVWESDDTSNWTNRVDSNGTRWLGLVWYCPDGGNPEDLSQYRLYQLDLIEECYSTYASGLSSNRYAYFADSSTEPILYSRYKSVYGSLTLNEVLYEAANRMSLTSSTKLRVWGETDPDYDYSTTPTSLTIKQALADIETYIAKGTYVEITGVITRFVGNNFYLADADNYALYVYMGIDGKSIGSMFSQGDTIKIRGRLCEYGGQYQLSDVKYEKSTFTKVTDESQKISMPEPIVLKGTETADELHELIGKLVTGTMKVKSCGSYSKDYSYSVNSSNTISGLGGSYNTFSIRINGTLSPGYEKDEFEGSNGKFTGKNVKVTGILSIYQDTDYTQTVYPSYQYAVGNRPSDDSDIVVVE